MSIPNTHVLSARYRSICTPSSLHKIIPIPFPILEILMAILPVSHICLTVPAICYPLFFPLVTWIVRGWKHSQPLLFRFLSSAWTLTQPSQPCLTPSRQCPEPPWSTPRPGDLEWVDERHLGTGTSKTQRHVLPGDNAGTRQTSA